MHDVLIVDDEQLIVEGMQSVIKWEELGLNIVMAASSAEQALAYLNDNKVDIVITDIRMGAMDGLEMITKAKRYNSRTKYIILSGYNDFQYVKQGIKLGIENYILKPVDENELTATLMELTKKLDDESNIVRTTEDNKSVLRETIIYRWLTGRIESGALRHRAEMLDIDLYQNDYQAGVLRILQAKDANAGHVSHAIHHAFRDIEGVSVEVCAGYNGDYPLLISGEALEGMEPRIKRCLQEAVAQISYAKIAVFVSLGDVVTEFIQASASYKQALMRAELSLVMPINSIVDKQTTSMMSASRKETLNISYDELKQALHNVDEQAAIVFADQTFDRLLALGELSPQTIKNITIEMLYQIASTGSQNPAIGRGVWDAQTFFERTFSAQTIPQLKELTYEMIKETMGRIKGISGNRDPVIVRALEIIREQYATDLTLKSLSDVFKMNPVYLGQLFKNQVGEMFTAYLNTVRVGKAAQLLAETNTNMSEVAELVGYSSYGYFCNIFKKTMGVNPKEYRRNTEKKEDLATDESNH